MSSMDKINELASRKEKIELGGGADKIAKQHGSGKMTARERINALFDEKSFVEIDSFVESRSIDFGMQKKKLTGDGVVTGYGTVLGEKRGYTQSHQIAVDVSKYNDGGTIEKDLEKSNIILNRGVTVTE